MRTHMYSFRQLLMSMSVLSHLLSSSVGRPCLAADEPAVARVKRGVIRDVCSMFYWGGPDRKVQGHSWPLKITIADDHFYAHLEFGSGRLRTRLDYWGVDTGQRASIRGNYLSDFEEKLQHNPIDTTITIPTDCTPKYDPPTPEKRHMIETVVRSIREDLTQYRDLGITRYPKEVTLVIANFNVDDLDTYVLVLPQKDVYLVKLHDPDWEDDAAYQERAYFARDIPNAEHRRALIPKIREQGIIRKVRLGAGVELPSRPATPSTPVADTKAGER